MSRLGMHEEAYRLAVRLNARYAQVEVAVNWSGRWPGSGATRTPARSRGSAWPRRYDSTSTLRNKVWSLRELGRLDGRLAPRQRAAGANPTLALIANARLVDMHARAAIRRRLAPMRCWKRWAEPTSTSRTPPRPRWPDPRKRRPVDRVSATCNSRPRPVAARGTERALAARGHDPRTYLGAPSDPH
jgi:glutathione S-transferase